MGHLGSYKLETANVVSRGHSSLGERLSKVVLTTVLKPLPASFACVLACVRACLLAGLLACLPLFCAAYLVS